MSEDPHLQQYFSAAAQWERGDVQGARRAFELLTLEIPHFAPAWDGLGRIYAAQDDLRAAERCFHRAMRLDRLSWRIPFNWGRSLAAAGRMQEAIRWLRRAHRLQRGHRLPLFELAGLLLIEGRSRRALSCLHQAVKLPEPAGGPSEAQILHLMARCHHAAGDLSLADQAFQKSCLIQPDNPALFRHWAVTLRAAGESDAALQMARRGAAMAPHDADAATLPARFLLEDGRWEELDSALRALEAARLPMEARALRALGSFKQKKLREAQQQALESLAGASLSPAALESILELLRLLRDRRGNWRGFRITLRMRVPGGSYYRSFLVQAADEVEACRLAEEIQQAMEPVAAEVEEVESFRVRDAGYSGVHQVSIERRILPQEVTCAVAGRHAWAG